MLILGLAFTLPANAQLGKLMGKGKGAGKKSGSFGTVWESEFDNKATQLAVAVNGGEHFQPVSGPLTMFSPQRAGIGHRNKGGIPAECCRVIALRSVLVMSSFAKAALAARSSAETSAAKTTAQGASLHRPHTRAIHQQLARRHALPSLPHGGSLGHVLWLRAGRVLPDRRFLHDVRP